MDGLFTLLKPAQFKSMRDSDPETILQDFEDYVEVMQKFFTTTGQQGGTLTTTQTVLCARRRRP